MEIRTTHVRVLRAKSFVFTSHTRQNSCQSIVLTTPPERSSDERAERSHEGAPFQPALSAPYAHPWPRYRADLWARVYRSADNLTKWQKLTAVLRNGAALRLVGTHPH